MPSSTFLNLSPEKQEKLLTAAVREFTEQPYNKASINRIIRDARIPRGSFYMYFRDKEGLFHYLMQESIDQVLLVLEKILQSNGGDPFEALPALYDYLRARQSGDEGLGSIGLLAVIVNRNCGLQMSGLIEFVDVDAVVDRVAENVDPSLLDLREEQDLHDSLRVLLMLSVPIIYHGLRPDDPLDGRGTLERVLKLLRRGVAAKPAVPDGK